jgi:hypothetical protein
MGFIESANLPWRTRAPRNYQNPGPNERSRFGFWWKHRAAAREESETRHLDPMK